MRFETLWGLLLSKGERLLKQVELFLTAVMVFYIFKKNAKKKIKLVLSFKSKKRGEFKYAISYVGLKKTEGKKKIEEKSKLNQAGRELTLNKGGKLNEFAFSLFLINLKKTFFIKSRD